MNKIAHSDFYTEENVRLFSSKRNMSDLLSDKDNPVVFLDVAINDEKGISHEVIKYRDVNISL